MSSSASPPQVGPCKMELRVAAIVLLMVAMAAGHGSYVVKKMVKAAPQYQPYSVKGQGKKTLLFTSCFLASQHACFPPQARCHRNLIFRTRAPFVTVVL